MSRFRLTGTRLTRLLVVAAALMLSLLSVLRQRPSGGAEPDDRARARRLRIACRLGGSRQRAAQARLPDGDPELGLESVADDVAIVRSTLDSIPGDKILVGHSYGGFVITNAATGRTDVRGLVYTAAYVPESGETITTLGEGYIAGRVSEPSGVRRPAVPHRHRRPAILPRGLRPGLESEAGRRDRSPAAPNEPGPLRHSIRTGRLARVSRRGMQSRPTTAPSTLPCSGSWPSALDRRPSSSPRRATWAASRTTRRAS